MKKNVKSDELAATSSNSAMKKMSSPLSSSSPLSAASSSSSSASGQGHRFSLAMSSTSSPSSSSRTHKSDDPAKIFKLIDENVIGKSAVFLGPYGRRKGELDDYKVGEQVVFLLGSQRIPRNSSLVQRLFNHSMLSRPTGENKNNKVIKVVIKYIKRLRSIII